MSDYDSYMRSSQTGRIISADGSQQIGIWDNTIPTHQSSTRTDLVSGQLMQGAQNRITQAKTNTVDISNQVTSLIAGTIVASAGIAGMYAVKPAVVDLVQKAGIQKQNCLPASKGQSGFKTVDPQKLLNKQVIITNTTDGSRVDVKDNEADTLKMDTCKSVAVDISKIIQQVSSDGNLQGKIAGEVKHTPDELTNLHMIPFTGNEWGLTKDEDKRIDDAVDDERFWDKRDEINTILSSTMKIEDYWIKKLTDPGPWGKWISEGDKASTSLYKFMNTPTGKFLVKSVKVGLFTHKTHIEAQRYIEKHNLPDSMKWVAYTYGASHAGLLTALQSIPYVGQLDAFGGLSGQSFLDHGLHYIEDSISQKIQFNSDSMYEKEYGNIVTTHSPPPNVLEGQIVTLKQALNDPSTPNSRKAKIPKILERIEDQLLIVNEGYSKMRRKPFTGYANFPKY